MLDLNSSFLWIFFLVWLLYFVLDRIFFKPVGKIIAEREAKIAADSERQEGMMAEIEARTRAVETQLSQARQEAQRIREEWLKNGEELRARALWPRPRSRRRGSWVKKSPNWKARSAPPRKPWKRKSSVFSEKIRQAYL